MTKTGGGFTDSLVLSFNLVFPIFVLLALGYGIRRTKILDDSSVKMINKLVFTIFLPVSIFKNVYESEFSSVFDVRLIAYGVLSVVSCFALMTVFSLIFVRKKESRSVLIQGVFRSNFLIFGIPVAESLFADGSLLGKASVMIAVIVPVYNVLAVITLETLGGKKADYKKILLNIIKNPLIIGSVCGFLGVGLKEAGLTILAPLHSAVASVSGIATPLALVALGASLNFSSIKGNLAYIIWGIGGKLVLAPLIFMIGAVFLGFRDRELAIMLAMHASPAAVSSYTMAQQMGADEDLAGQLVVFGTAASIITVFLWVSALTYFGFITPVL